MTAKTQSISADALDLVVFGQKLKLAQRSEADVRCDGPPGRHRPMAATLCYFAGRPQMVPFCRSAFRGQWPKRGGRSPAAAVLNGAPSSVQLLRQSERRRAPHRAHSPDWQA